MVFIMNLGESDFILITTDYVTSYEKYYVSSYEKYYGVYNESR